MPKFNDWDLREWREIEANVDSLWLIPNRDKSGRHCNVYHGNFIPQIPNELINRYTKKGELVIDAFLGSGTTLYECERLQRKCIGLDINEKILEFVSHNMEGSEYRDYRVRLCDNTNRQESERCITQSLYELHAKSAQFVFFHPPYLDIVKFTNHPNDLSAYRNIQDFVPLFLKSCQNVLRFLQNNRYFAIVVGDVYQNGEVKPLGFYIMDAIQKHFNVTLKGIVVKNIEGNRGKLGMQTIWRYRALSSDYFLFKHEYIFVFKKEGDFE